MKPTVQMFLDPVFFVFFVFFFIVLAISIVLTILRATRLGGQGAWSSFESQTAIKEREIIREIVKIRCPTVETFMTRRRTNAQTVGATRHN